LAGDCGGAAAGVEGNGDSVKSAPKQVTNIHIYVELKGGEQNASL